jgi:hypothetical protein
MPLISALRPRLKLRSLLSSGYFPPELPPPFSTTLFADVLSRVPASALPEAFTKQQSEWCDFVSYSLSRPGSLRRRLAVVNPLAYHRLAKFIVANQQILLKKAGSSHLSLGKVVINLFGTLRRANSFDAVPLHRAMIQIGQQFVLVADVSRFYPSIYTHSIEWAITSKARAKRHLKKRGKQASVGASLDRLIQACQSGQTRGFPIGPVASMLMAEILLTKVDAKLKTRAISTGFRYADDYELTFAERSQAERALTVLEDALAEFELELNPAKTGIFELPQELDNPGIQELRRFQFRALYQSERSDLMHFFTRAFALHRQYADKAILRYAVSRLAPGATKPANADLIQALILQAVCYESGVWPMAIQQLLALEVTHPGRSKANIGATIHSMIRKCAHLNHSSEVAWSLWAALVFDIKISKAATTAISRMVDDCCYLLLFHAAERGLTAVKPSPKTLDRWFVPAALRGPHWLLAYELVVKGWVARPTSPDHISQDPVFEFLRRNGVEFYDKTELQRTKGEEGEEDHDEDVARGYGS